MTVWLAKRLAGEFGSYFLAVILTVVAMVTLTLGGLLIKEKLTTHGLRDKVAAKRVEVAEAVVGKTLCESNTVTLESALADQNSRIDALQLERDAAQQAASLAGVRMLNLQRARAADLPQGHGPDQMNLWLQQVVE